MAHYDKHTEKFMRDVMDQPSESHSPDLRDIASSARLATKIISNPGKTVAKLITKEVVKNVMDKEGSLKVLDIYRLLNDLYKKEWWTWEGETLWNTLKEDHDLPSSREFRDLVQAFQTIVTTNYAHENWHVFEKVAHALNMNYVDFALIQPLELNEAAVALKLIPVIRPEQEFDDEVYGYIAALAKQSGVVYLPPDLFGRAQSFLDGLNNDLELKAEIAQRWPKPIRKDDPLSIKIQLLRLKEISDACRGVP